MVIQGAGGLRKLRLSDPKRDKGKRGGVRVYYLYVPEKDRIYLIDIHDKDEKAYLSPDELKVLGSIVSRIKAESNNPARSNMR